MNKGLTTNQLLFFIKHNCRTKCRFVGVFSINNLPKYLTKNSCLIFNSDPTSKPGSHWLALFMNSNKEMEFFDSYGLNASFYKLTKKNLPSHYSLKCNITQLQDLYSTKCGYFCLYYIYYKVRQYKLENIFENLFKNNLQQNDALITRLVKCLYICNRHFSSMQKL